MFMCSIKSSVIYYKKNRGVQYNSNIVDMCKQREAFMGSQ